MLSLEGKQLGNYDVIRRIRVGGMGAVYEGRQRTAFGRHVAIKVILGDYASDPDMRRRFAREARTVARLQHPHILSLIEFGDAHGILYLVMPFIEGGTLTSYLRRSLPDLADVATIYTQLLDAVEYAHEQGLIHRDIKSSNVLLDMRRDGSPYVYLADFGLVRTLRPSTMDDTSKVGKPIPLDQVPGTPHYMAPEQTRGIVTPLTDIYALGVLLYQLLTGELPYNDPDDVRVIQMHMQNPIPSPCDADASIPRELEAVVRTAMAKRSDERYRNVSALRAAFLAAINGPVASVQEDAPVVEENSPSLLPPAPPPLRRPSALTGSFTEHPQPVPIIMPQRVRRNDVPVAVREARAKVRNTDTVRHKQRITEEPLPRKSKRLNVPLLAAMIVPLFLIILLIMPRILGFSVFPVGFPLLGMPPVATIYVTAQSRTLQDSYVLTASPQIKVPDPATHTIPNRLLSNGSSDSNTVSTTGTRTLPGVQALGAIELINTTGNTVAFSAQRIFTSTTGVQVQLTQNVQVPSRHNGQDGRITAAATALTPGVAGNIPAHTLDGTCCNNGVNIQNSAPFTGGVDGKAERIVAQADVDAATKTLKPKLQQMALRQIQQQLMAGEVIAGAPSYNVTTSTSSPVGAPGTSVQVTLKVVANATIYNRDTASQIAMRLLSEKAAQMLGRAYMLQGKPALVGLPSVHPGKNGIIYLSIAVRGLWVYNLTPEQTEQWPLALKGSTPAVALAFLNVQPGVKSVEIRLPFGADRLPSTIDEIKIVLVSST